MTDYDYPKTFPGGDHALPRVLNIAHRGNASAFPENTLAAFTNAVKLGADMLEADIQYTRDGRIVVIHDNTVDRTSDGAGRVNSLTLREIDGLDAGGWFDERFRGERIPTLEALLDLAADRALLNIEIKEEGDEGDGTGIEYDAVSAVLKRSLGGQVIFSSFDLEVISRIKARYPTMSCGVLWGGKIPDDPREIPASVGADALHPLYEKIDGAQVKRLREGGFWVNVWTVDDPADMRRFVDWGVSGIITDYPGRLNEVLNSGQPDD